MEWSQVFRNEPAPDLQQCLCLVIIQRAARQEYAVGTLKTAVLCHCNMCLWRGDLQVFPNALETQRMPRRLGGEVVCPAKDLPQLAVADHLQKAFWVSGQLSRCGVDEHLVPSLLMLVPCKYHRLAIRLGEEVCVDMQGKPGQLFGGQECVEQALGQRLRINSQAYA